MSIGIKVPSAGQIDGLKADVDNLNGRLQKMVALEGVEVVVRIKDQDEEPMFATVSPEVPETVTVQVGVSADWDSSSEDDAFYN